MLSHKLFIKKCQAKKAKKHIQYISSDVDLNDLNLKAISSRSFVFDLSYSMTGDDNQICFVSEN